MYLCKINTVWLSFVSVREYIENILNLKSLQEYNLI